jgi:hypothetical protein
VSSERKYVMTRVGRGDYLLPGNDGTTLWRLRTYEDGPSHGLDWPRDLTFWGIWKWDRSLVADSDLDTVDPGDWDRWEHVEGQYESRREAIDAALKLEGAGS